MNLTAIFYPFYFIIKTLITYPSEDIDIYIDAYTQINNTVDDDAIFKQNWDYSK